MDVRYKDEAGGHSRFMFLVNGAAQGRSWDSMGEGKGWTTHTSGVVTIRPGDQNRGRGAGRASLAGLRRQLIF